MDRSYADTQSFRGIKTVLYIAASWMVLMRLLSLTLNLASLGVRSILAVLATGTICVLLWGTERRIQVCPKEKKLNFYAGVISFLSLYGVMLITETRKSILWLIILPMFYYAIRHILQLPIPKKTRIWADISGCIFASAMLLGNEADHFDEIIVFNTREYSAQEISMQLFSGICLFAFFCIILSALLYYLCQTELTETQRSGSIQNTVSYAAGILLFWTPYYVAFYPGILDKDSLSEISQQLGFEAMSNHHPIMHQMVVRACLETGKMFGSITAGVGIYTAIQMLMMAAVFSLCISELKAYGAGKRILIPVFLFFAVFTVHPFFAITMWKDVLFGGLSLLLSILILRVLNKNADRERWRAFPGLLITAFFYSTMRNNGYYAFVLGIIAIALMNRANRRFFLVLLLAVVALVSVYHHILFNSLGIRKSRTAEALSIPLQQIARVVTFAEIDLNDENFSILKEVFPDIEELKTDYISIISDPVKHENVFQSEVFDSNPIRYLGAWARVGLQHPRAYLEAFLLQNYGYWYPDVDYTIVYPRLRDNEMGLEANPPFVPLRESLLSMHLALSKEQPISVLYSVGLMIWLMMLSGITLALKGQKEKAAPLMIHYALWITTLASPVFCEYRYIYAIVTCVPLFVSLAVLAPNKNGAQKDEYN